MAEKVVRPWPDRPESSGPPTTESLRTDDSDSDTQSQYRALHYNASRGDNSMLGYVYSTVRFCAVSAVTVFLSIFLILLEMRCWPAPV